MYAQAVSCTKKKNTALNILRSANFLMSISKLTSDPALKAPYADGMLTVLDNQPDARRGHSSTDVTNPCLSNIQRGERPTTTFA